MLIETQLKQPTLFDKFKNLSSEVKNVFNHLHDTSFLKLLRDLGVVVAFICLIITGFVLKDKIQAWKHIQEMQKIEDTRSIATTKNNEEIKELHVEIDRLNNQLSKQEKKSNSLELEIKTIKTAPVTLSGARKKIVENL